MKKITFILTLMLTLFYCDAMSQNFNEDSLYDVIRQMADSDEKLDLEVRYMRLAYNIPRIKEISSDASALSERLGRPEMKARALSTMGWAYAVGDNDYNTAIEYFFKALTINDTLGVSQEIIVNKYQLSSAFFNMENIGLGIKYLEEAMELSESTHDSTFLSTGLYLLGAAYTKQSMFNFAHDRFLQSAGISMARGDTMQAYMAAYGMAANYCDRYEEEHQTQYLDSAKIIMDTVFTYLDGVRHTYLPVYQNIPGLFLSLADRETSKAGRERLIKKAEDLCDQGIRLVKSTGQTMFLDRILSAKAKVLIRRGKTSEAKKIIDALPDNIASELYIKYYKATGDYRNLMRQIDENNKAKYRKAAVQYLVTYNQNPAEELYKEQKAKHDSTILALEQEQIHKEKIYSHIQDIMVVIAVFLALSGGMMAIFWRQAQDTNNQIRLHNEIIEGQNRKMEGAIQKVYEQKQEIENQTNTLYMQTKTIEGQLTKMMNGLMYAKSIQAAAIPSRDSMEKAFGQCLIHYQPLEVVSGDFYWMAQVDGLKLLAVCDCTGHSVPGGLLSMLGISMLNDIIAYRGYNTPDASAILNVLRKKIIKGIGEECDDGIDMALVIIDGARSNLHYAGAMRPLYLMRDGEIQIHRPDRMPIGRYLVKEKPFRETVIEYRQGDRLYMFSDGMTDIFNEDRSRKYSEKEFRELIGTFCGMDFAEQERRLHDFYQSWGARAVIDDQVLIGIELR